MVLWIVTLLSYKGKQMFRMNILPLSPLAVLYCQIVRNAVIQTPGSTSSGAVFLPTVSSGPVRAPFSSPVHRDSVTIFFKICLYNWTNCSLSTLQHGRWKERDFPKCQYPSTKLHGTTTKKSKIWRAAIFFWTIVLMVLRNRAFWTLKNIWGLAYVVLEWASSPI